MKDRHMNHSEQIWSYEDRFDNSRKFHELYNDEIKYAVDRGSYDFDDANFEELGTIIKDNYSFIRGYHGTRVIDEAPYLSNGIQPLTLEWVRQRVKYLLDSIQVSVSERELDHAITDVVGVSRLGLVYFSAVKCALTDSCSHYSILGSEAVYAVLIRLVDTFTAKKLAKRHGRESILVCDIPIKQISIHQLGDLCAHALLEITTPDYREKCPALGYNINGILLPDHIKAFEYPKGMRLPLGM